MVGELIPELGCLFFSCLYVCVIMGVCVCAWVAVVFMFCKACLCLLFQLLNQNYPSVSIPGKSWRFTVPVPYYTHYICKKPFA